MVNFMSILLQLKKKKMGEGVTREMPNKDFRGEKQREYKKVTPRRPDKIM